MKIANYSVGKGEPLLLICGPCQIESAELCDEIAATMKEICATRDVNWVFKASFDKANRTSIHSPRGPGMKSGLAVLHDISQRYGVPATTDVHEREQCEAVAEVCALLQIPAFLSRQTDLLVAAARAAQARGGAVNVKKGQFLAPEDIKHAAQKVRDAGCENVLLTERGTTFGYNNLVVDFRGLEIMREFAPVCFDATHSVQKPGGGNGVSGGDRRFVPPLARAAMAVGIDALFIETHPRPDEAASDGPNTVALKDMPALLDELLAIRAAVNYSS
ncbi:MAG TPA: 3-deoxy-8-phosphooctulonate synthase [Abditibacteriaceae bacterium]|jgi:2-dehydro-3-deoxyphosphooctonate aldolase (KDO 8-P synthase)